MKKKIIYGLLFVVAMVTASSSFVSCKDYEGDNYAEFQEKLASLQDAYNKQVQAMQDYVLTSRYNAETGYSAEELAAKGTIKKRLDDLEKDTTSLANRIAENNKAIAVAQGLAERDSVYLRQLLLGWDNGGSLGDMVTEAAGLLQDLLRDTAHYNFAYDTLSTYYKDWKFAYDTLSTYYEEWNRAVIIADSALSVADKARNFVNKGEVAGRGQKFETLQDMADAYDAAVDSLQDQINELFLRVDSIKNAMRKQVTGIIVQGTYSPVFGSGSLPLGIQTNILAAYASKAAVSAEVIFPSNVSADYVNNKATLTAKDLEFAQQFVSYTDVAVQPNQLLISEAADNAGKMYLTVNPTNIDFKDTKFTLVNSQGDECKVKLSALKPSQEVLKFGWTRTTIDAASENGFYEVNAQITKDDALKMQPEIDKEGFKDAVKKAVDGQKRMAVKEIARALFNSLQPVQRFGIQAKWYDDVKNTDVLYTSAYDVAAFTLNPLGFGFKVPSGKGTRIPTIDKKLIADELHINLTVEPLVVTAKDKATGKYVMLVEIPLMALDGDLLAQFKTTGNIYQGYPVYYDTDDGYFYAFDGVEFRSGYAYIDFTKLFEQMYGDFTAALESNFNNAAGTINKRLDDIAAAINSYVDNANSWINRVNNLIDRLGDAVQPVLLWSDGKNAGELGGFVSANYAVGTAVKAGKEIALVPTSYSLELFAPAYKKSLLVTNAYKGGKSAQSGASEELVNAVKTFSEQFKDYAVFEGNALTPISVKADSKFAGITFEIAYTAMDYEGKIAGRKFYLTVVE